MKITSPIVGEVEVSSDRIIEFPAGLPGFEACRQFTLLHDEGSEAPQAFMLQSLNDPDVMFSVTTPDVLGLNYEFTLSDDEVAALQLTNPDDVSLLLIVRHNDSADSNPAESPVRANLMAPLVVNTTTRRGLQKVIGRVDTRVTLHAVA
ncbi:MAG: flagellar assembly protein FliW [Zoogloea oleivorans]|jgi:flagellar assembly factor FliW|uniref:flagellar assembly protein FliW n=1 Tax=Zoogloea oleivorans TaxID=1552750 RepID=UPI002A359C5B|nr:flagellar assembly protein FliW [Zoogloea oleivorans]MDY0036162.1 flagellar assembly protein FliW [Zoogloea oleivorans]